MALTLILSVGLNADLLSTRNAVLQAGGYFVVPAYSLIEAVERFQGGDFDLVLLCPSVLPKEKERLIAWIRASGSRIPVVVVSETSVEHGYLGGSTVGSRPEELLAGIREILIKAERTVWMSSPCRNRKSGVTPSSELCANQEKKPAQSAAVDEGKALATNDRSVVLAHAS
jgi:DNA-binding response OmpR family regulator